MATQLFANNASSALASDISAVSTSVSVGAGHGALFPSPSAGDWFLLTLTQASASGPESSWEIVKVTARSTDTLTVVRAQEATAAAIWASGSKAESRLTGGSLVAAVAGGQAGLLLGTDKTKLDAVTGTNSGDNAVNSNYSALVSNATHSGDVTGATALTITNKVTMTGTSPVSVSGSPTVIAGSAVAISIAAATTGAAGSMSSTDKTKLDSLGFPASGVAVSTGSAWTISKASPSGTLVGTTDTQTLTGKQWQAYSETVTIVGTVSTATYNIDLSLSNVFDITLGANVTFTFTNPPTSGISRNCTVILRQDATGSRLATFTGAKFTDGTAPILSTGASQIDVLSFFTLNGGTFWFGTFAMANVS